MASRYWSSRVEPAGEECIMFKDPNPQNGPAKRYKSWPLPAPFLIKQAYFLHYKYFQRSIEILFLSRKFLFVYNNYLFALF